MDQRQRDNDASLQSCDIALFRDAMEYIGQIDPELPIDALVDVLGESLDVLPFKNRVGLRQELGLGNIVSAFGV